MKIFRNFEEILDYAIDKEMEEIEFYSNLAGRMDRKNVSVLFHNIMLEKTSRVLRLEKMKDLKAEFDSNEVQDMKLAGNLAEIDHQNSNLSYQDALILAMKREKEKFKFYTKMAECAINNECRSTFINLANEEARQKLKFEIEYDEYILIEN
ncbi:ferritin family protein [Ancylomarina longa]|uniref:Rubrerythrin diiron-binding domain-containing protein n=1 Tax=Ancylomarina longa TaxID=2487017 RepID=A0A434ATN5_9BACT|nr:ferritin family protein [Ancylomarina longa]RUT77690.1 hypothetical protein DLK05_12245 [Ancylomarina longa]